MCSEYTNSTGECNELHSGVFWVATHVHQLILCLFTFISSTHSVGPGEWIIKCGSRGVHYLVVQYIMQAVRVPYHNP